MYFLDGAYVRLRRAEECLGYLQSLIRDFVNEEYKLVRQIPRLDEYPTDMLLDLISKQSPNIPAEIPVVVGETVYHLRLALNLLANELTVLDSGSTQEDVEFPLLDSPDEFVRWRKTHLKGINELHTAAIERLQPYGTRNWKHPFRLLRQLAEDDQSGGIVLKRQTGCVGSGSEDRAYFDSPDDESADCILIKQHVGERESVHMKFHFTLQIMSKGGLPIMDSLQEIKTKVADTLAQFEPEF